MRITALLAGAAIIAFAAPASAQVLGGINGQVGGGLSARPGDLGASDTINATRAVTRATARDARDTASRDRSVDARVDISADSDTTVSSDGATIGLDAQVGARVRSRDGHTLGEVVGFSRATARDAAHVLVQSADGVTRGVEATRVSTEASGDLTADMSQRQFRRQPATQTPRASDRNEYAQ